MKNEEMLTRLWNHMGTNDPYYTLIDLNEYLAYRIEDAYAAEYETAQEREDDPYDMFAAPGDLSGSSKSGLIGAWAVEIKRAIVKAYIAQYSAEELEAMRSLLSRGGLNPEITICQGVTINYSELKKED